MLVRAETFRKAQAAAYSPNGVVFDGTNDYGSRTSALSGATATNSFTLVFAIKPNLTSTLMRIFDIKTSGFVNRFFVQISTSNTLELFGENSSGTELLDVTATSALTDGVWQAVAISLDLSNSSNRHMLVDGTDLFPGTPTTYTNGSIDFTGAEVGLGATGGGAAPLDGELADFWFEAGRYVDLSVGANLAKFYDGSNCLVDKGVDGSTPFSAEPTMYCGDDNDEANWFTDNTTNNNDFVENGDLTNSSADPCGA